MGWGRMWLLGNIGQQMDIEDLRAQLTDANWRAASDPTPQRVAALQRENDELRLYVAAILRLLVSKKVATAEELRALVEAIDLEDGVRDTKFEGSLSPPEEKDWHEPPAASP